MSQKLFAAGVGVLQGFAADGTWLFRANTLTDSSVEITSAVEEVRVRPALLV